MAFDANNLVFIAAKVPQILANLRSKQTGQLSLITCTINVVGNVARIFTSVAERAGPAMLRTYIISESREHLRASAHSCLLPRRAYCSPDTWRAACPGVEQAWCSTPRSRPRSSCTPRTRLLPERRPARRRSSSAPPIRWWRRAPSRSCRWLLGLPHCLHTVQSVRKRCLSDALGLAQSITAVGVVSGRACPWPTARTPRSRPASDPRTAAQQCNSTSEAMDPRLRQVQSSAGQSSPQAAPAPSAGSFRREAGACISLPSSQWWRQRADARARCVVAGRRVGQCDPRPAIGPLCARHAPQQRSCVRRGRADDLHAACGGDGPCSAWVWRSHQLRSTSSPRRSSRRHRARRADRSTAAAGSAATWRLAVQRVQAALHEWVDSTGGESVRGVCLQRQAH